MRYLKSFNSLTTENWEREPTWEKYKQLLSRFDSGELSQLIQYFFEDELDYINCDVSPSKHSQGMDNSIHYNYLTPEASEYLINNSFMIDFYLDHNTTMGGQVFLDRPSISPLVGKISTQTKLFNEHLKSYGLKVVFDEYGLGESTYEIFISDINLEFDPQMK